MKRSVSILGCLFATCLLFAPSAAQAADGTPTILSVVTQDTSGDGQIDHVLINFDEPVVVADPGTDTDGLPAFTLSGGYTLVGNVDYTSVSTSVLLLEVTPSGSPDTGVIFDVTYGAPTSTITAVAAPGNELATGTTAAADGAKPSVVAQETADLNDDGYIDALYITFSEPIMDSTVDVVAPGVEFGIDGATNLAFSSTTNGDIADDKYIYITFADGDLATDATPDLEYTGTTLRDPVSPLNTMNTFANFTPTDKAAPVIWTVETADLDGDGYTDAHYVTFSEDISDASVAFGNFAVSDGPTVLSFATGPLPADIDDNAGHITFDDGSLDSGATPTLTYTAGTLVDLVGNAMITTAPALASTDKAAPVIWTVETADLIGPDGYIDALYVTFSEDIDDSTVTFGDFAVTGGVAVTGFTTGVVDDDNGHITFTDGVQATDATPDLTYTVGDLEDLVNNAMITTAPALASTDAARPVIWSATSTDEDANGQVDRITLTFSESVDVDDTGGAGDGLPAFTLSGAYGIAGGNYAASSVGTLALTVTESGGPDTDAVINVTYTAGSDTIQDVSPAAMEMATATKTGTDGALPVIWTISTVDADVNGYIDAVFITMSEPVSDASIDPLEFVVGAATNLVISSGAANDATFSITFDDDVLGTGVTPGVGYTQGTLEDLAAIPNLLDTVGPFTPTDAAIPVILSATSTDGDDDGEVETVTLVFSEPVDVVDLGDPGLPCVALSDGYLMPAFDYTSGPVGTLALTLTQKGTPDTDVTIDVTYSDVTTSSIMDPVGNEVANVMTTGTDGALPTVITAETADINGDGYIDNAHLVFSEAISDATVVIGEFTLDSGATNLAFSSTTNGDGAGDNDIYISFDDGSLGTGVTPTAGYGAVTTTLADLNGNLMAAQGGPLDDAALPVIMARETVDASGTAGLIDAIVITMSEDISDASIAFANFTIAGAPSTGSDTGAGADDDTFSIIVTEVLAGGATPNVTYTQGTLVDLATVPNFLASTGAVAADDLVKPVIWTISTVDGGPNGYIEAVFVTMSEPIDDGTFDVTDFGVAGASNLVFASGAPDDATFSITFDDNDLHSGVTPNVTYTQDTLADLAGNLLATIAPFTPTDAAIPVILSATSTDADDDGEVETVTLVFSESVNVVDNGDPGLPCLGLSDGYLMPNGDYNSGSVGTLALTLTQKGTPDTDVTIDVTYSDAGTSSIMDLVGNEVANVMTTGTDGALPTVMTAETVDRDGDGYIDAAHMTFSENIDDATVTASIGNFAVLGAGALSFTSGAGGLDTANDDDIYLMFTNVTALGTGATPNASYTPGTVADLAGNLMAGGGGPLDDKALPVIMARETADTDDNGSIDRIVFTMSEDISDASVNTGHFTIGAYAISGFSSGTADDETFAILLTEAGPDGGATPVVTYTKGTLADGNANLLATVGPVAAVDKTLPIILPAGLGGLLTVDADVDGYIDAVLITMSEPISDASVDVADFGIAGASNLVFSTGVADDDSFSITFDDGDLNSGETPNVTYTKGTLKDRATVPNLLNSTAPITPTDNAIPVLWASTTSDTNGNGRIDTLTINFSETVTIVDSGAAGVDGMALVPAYAIPAADYGATTASLVLPLTESGGSDTDVVISPTFAVPPSSIVDANGNSLANNATVAGTDGALPVIMSATTSDADLNGHIDGLTLVFSEPVNVVDSGDPGLPCVTVAGYAVADLDYASGPVGTLALTLTESGSGDTGATPSVTYAAGASSIRDPALNQVANGATASTDGAAPIIMAAETDDSDYNGKVDRLTLIFSEDVNVTDSGDVPGGLPGVTLSGGYEVAADTYGGGPMGTLTLTVTELGPYDTQVTIAPTYVSGDSLIEDTAGIEVPNGNTVAGTDDAEPVIVAQETADLDADGFIDAVYLTFSEDIKDSTVFVADFSVGSGTVALISFLTGTGGIDDNTGHITFTDGILGTGIKPDVDYTQGSLTDLPGNHMSTLGSVLTPTDNARPVILSAATSDDDANGQVDRLTLTFSELVTVTDGAAGDGLNTITLDGLPPYAIENADYYAASTIGLVLMVAEKAVADTGVIINPSYDDTKTHKIVDAVGLELEALSVAGVDGAKPSIIDQETADLNADGFIDAVLLTFSENIDDTTVVPGDFDIAGATGFAFSPTTNGDVAGDDKIYITFTDDVLATDATPDISYVKGSFSDPVVPVANFMDDDGPLVPLDKARPVIMSAVTDDGDGDTHIDLLTLTFSEDVNVVDAGDPGLPCVGLSGGYAVPANDYTSGPVGALALTLTQSAEPDTGVVIDPTYTAGTSSIKDVAGNEVRNGITMGTDGAKPQVLTVESALAGDKVVVSFSEPMNPGTVNPGTLDADLVLAGLGGETWGTSPSISWAAGNEYLIITLGTAAVVTPGISTVDPEDTVTDPTGNPDDTQAPFVIAVGTPPEIMASVVEASPYIYVDGTNDIYYGDKMGGVAQTFALEGTASDLGSGLDRITFTSATGLGAPPDDTTPAEWSGAYTDVDSADTWENPVVATVYDRAGNSASAVFTVTRDIDAPGLTLLTVSAGGPNTYWSGATLYYSNDNLGMNDVFTISLTDDGGGSGRLSATGEFAFGETSIDDTYGGQWDVTYSILAGETCDGGSGAITVTVSDNVGNTSTIDVPVTLDNASPVISVPAPAIDDGGSEYLHVDDLVDHLKVYYGDDMPGNETFTVSGTAVDVGGAGLERAVFDSNALGTPADDTSPTIWSGDYANVDASDTFGDPTPETFNVTLLDNVGNTAVQAFTAVRDTTAPVLTFTGITESSPYIYWDDPTLYYSNDQAMTDHTFTISMTDTEAGSGTAYASGEEAFNDTPVDATYGPPWEIDYTISTGETCDGTITVTAKDNVGNLDTHDLTVVLDNAAPVITGPSIAELSEYLHAVGTTIYYGDDMSSDQTFTVQGSADDNVGGAGLDYATFTPDGDLGSPANDTDPASWSGAYNTVSNTDTSTGPLVVTVYDMVANSSTTSFTVVRDITAPTPTLDGVTESSPFIYWDTSPPKTLYYSSDQGMSDSFTVVVTDDEAGSGRRSATGEAAFGDTPTDTGYASQWDLDYTINTDETNDSGGTITVTVTDNVGNKDTVDVTVVLDNAGPVITSPAITESSPYMYVDVPLLTLYYGNGMTPSTPQTFTLSGDASDGGAGLDQATFPANELGGPLPDTDPAAWSGDYDDVDDGDNWEGTINVSLFDNVGNETQQGFIIIWDDEPPVLTITGITETSAYIHYDGAVLHFSNDQAMTDHAFTINLTDTEALSGRVSATGETHFGDTPTDGTYTTQWQLTYTIDESDVTDGTITITATDNVSNVDTIDLPVVLDNAGPVIADQAVVESSAYLHGSGSTVYYGNGMGGTETFSLEGTATDPAGVADATFESSTELGSPIDDPTGDAWSGAYNDVDSGDTLDDTLDVTVYDNVGNSSQTTFTVTRDITPPTATLVGVTESSGNIHWDTSILYFSNDQTMSDDFTIVITDDEAGSGRQSATGETHFGDTPSDTAYDTSQWEVVYTIDDPEISDGTITVTVTDNVGNSDWIDVDTTLDNVAPASITGLGVSTRTLTTLRWAWTNPVDVDFLENIVQIDAGPLVTTPNAYYEATGLTESTDYTITVHTRDWVGNTNTTDVTSTDATSSPGGGGGGGGGCVAAGPEQSSPAGLMLPLAALMVAIAALRRRKRSLT